MSLKVIQKGRNTGGNGRDQDHRDMKEITTMNTFTITLHPIHHHGIDTEEPFQEFVQDMATTWNLAKANIDTTL